MAPRQRARATASAAGGPAPARFDRARLPDDRWRAVPFDDRIALQAIVDLLSRVPVPVQLLVGRNLDEVDENLAMRERAMPSLRWPLVPADGRAQARRRVGGDFGPGAESAGMCLTMNTELAGQMSANCAVC